MQKHSYDELIDAWIKLQYHKSGTEEYNRLFWSFEAVLQMIQDDPDATFQFILDVLKRDSDWPVIGTLAAGPMEDLLSTHGDKVIERVEAQAKVDPIFAKMLGGVWKLRMSDENWSRLQKVWDRRGWDGIPE